MGGGRIDKGLFSFELKYFHQFVTSSEFGSFQIKYIKMIQALNLKIKYIRI